MFNRNEWLKWAEHAKNNNPSMRDFRSGYWRNIQEESNPVDECDIEPKQLEEIKIKDAWPTIKKYTPTPKKVVKWAKGDESGEKGEWANLKALRNKGIEVVSQAYVWNKMGGPTKKEKEKMERGDTRITLQPSSESVQEMMDLRLEKMMKQRKKIQEDIKKPNDVVLLSESVKYRIEELGYQLDEAFPLAAAIPWLLGAGKAALGGGVALAKGAVGTGIAAASKGIGTGATMLAKSKAGLAAGRALSATRGGLAKVGSKVPMKGVGKRMAKRSGNSKRWNISPPKPPSPSGIKKFIPGKEALKSTGKQATASSLGMAPFMLMPQKQPKPDTTVQSSGGNAGVPPPATGTNANSREIARQQRQKLAASVGRISSKYAQQLDESRVAEIHARTKVGQTPEKIGQDMDIHPDVIKKILQGRPPVVVRRTRLLTNPMQPVKIK